MVLTVGEKMEYTEKLKKHAKKIPCFTCVVRVSCSMFGADGQLYVRLKCNDFQEWRNKSDEIVYGTANKVIALAIKEVRLGEKIDKQDCRTRMEHKVRNYVRKVLLRFKSSLRYNCLL